MSKRAVKRRPTETIISELVEEAQAIDRFEFARPAKSVGALLAESRETSRLDEYLSDPEIVRCIFFDFPASAITPLSTTESPPSFESSGRFNKSERAAP